MKVKPYFDDEGNRVFEGKRNEDGNLDIYVRCDKVRRDGKWMSNLFLFSLTQAEVGRMKKALEVQDGQSEKEEVRREEDKQAEMGDSLSKGDSQEKPEN